MLREPDYIVRAEENCVRKAGNTGVRTVADWKHLPRIPLRVKHSKLIVALMDGEPNVARIVDRHLGKCRETERRRRRKLLYTATVTSDTTKLSSSGLCEPYCIVWSLSNTDSLNKRVTRQNSICPV